MDTELNIDIMKLLNKKLTCPAVSSRSTNSKRVVIHAVTQCANACHCQHQQGWRSSTRLRRRWTTETVHDGNCVTD